MSSADVLAGPIVRRVEPTLAAVWIALRIPAVVRLDIYRGLGPPRPAEHIAGKSTPVHTLAVGRALHIAVATFEPADTEHLDWGQTYAYDLRITTDGGTEVGLGELGLLADGTILSDDGILHDHLALGYNAGWLPSFVLPPPDPLSLRIAHGSCRGSNVEGKDAFPIVDDLLAAAIGNPLGRPHMLWLTGDQIYADSTGAEVVRSINALGSRLLSGSEAVTDHIDITFETGTPPVKVPARFPIDRTYLPPGRRAHLMRNFAGFTSDGMDSHLIGFGEWAAHYIMGWSNVSWPDLKPLLNARWPVVEQFQSDYKALLTAFSQRMAVHKPTEDLYKARDYYLGWKLIPEEARRIDAAMSQAQIDKLWGEKTPPAADSWSTYWAGAPYAGAPRVTSTSTAPISAPHADLLAAALTPAWFAGQAFFGVDIDKDGDVAGDQVRTRLHLAQQFYSTLPKVRRALANVATYMVFDDHEVTDDWNITAGWVTTNRSNPFGRAVIRNALTAFVLFQGWGNDPRAYADPQRPHSKVLAAIAKLYVDASGTPIPDGPDPDTAKELERLFDLRTLDQPSSPDRMQWHFRYDGPKFEILALDTRTHRSYEPDADPRIGQPFTNEANAALLTDEALHDQIPADPAPGVSPDGLCIVIAAAPFLGFPPIESLGQPILNRGTMFKEQRSGQFGELESWEDVGRVALDPEPWGFVPRLFAAVLERLSTRARVVFLSGDVHYSCTMAMSYWQQRNGQITPSRVIQCTSSSMRQMRKSSDVEMFSMDLVQQIASDLAGPVNRLGWHHTGVDNPPITPPAGKRFNDRVRYLLQKDPILLPTDALPAGTQLTRNFDYAWSMQLVFDERADVERLGDLNPPALKKPSDGWLETVRSVADRVIWQVERIPARRWIWWNNVCVVDFVGNMLRHSIYCFDLANQLATARPFATALVPLDVPATETPPAIPEHS